MLNKKIKDITTEDLEQLIENSVREGKQLEFKQDLPEWSDNGRKEFLADVSSVANTIGGYIIYGIKEENGEAKELLPIELDNPDDYFLKLESIIQDGLEPRIKFELKYINTKEDIKKGFLIIFIKKSWIAPHRVIFKRSHRFHARNSVGKYELDTLQLKEAFNFNETVRDKINNFKDGRIFKLIVNETPINFSDGSKVVLHFIPFESFDPAVKFDLEKYYNDPVKFVPLGKVRRNFDGFLTYNIYDNQGKIECNTYAQIYRNGIIEFVDGFLLERLGESNQIPCVAYERAILDYFKRSLGVIKELGIGAPIIFYLSLLDVKGYKMSTTSDIGTEDHSIEQDNLLLPEVIISNLDARPEDILRPILDLVWNACGFKESKNFDENNTWIAKQ